MGDTHVNTSPIGSIDIDDMLYVPSDPLSESVDMSQQPAYYINKGLARVYNAAINTLFSVCFNEVWQGHRLSELLDDLDKLFIYILKQAGEGLVDGDIGRVLIFNPELDNPIVIPLQRWQHITPDLIRQMIQNVLNSNKTLAIKANFNILVGVVHFPHGEGFIQLTNEASYYKKRGIIPIQNLDNKCLVRAIAVSYAYTLLEPESW